MSETTTTPAAPAAATAPAQVAPAAPAAPPAAPPAASAGGYDWKARAEAAEARNSELQTQLEEWKGHSRKHETASNKHFASLTQLKSERTIEDAAKAAGFRDPSDAYDLPAVREALEFNQDWTLKAGAGDKLKAALDSVLEKKPHWKVDTQPQGGGQTTPQTGAPVIPGTVPGVIPGVVTAPSTTTVTPAQTPGFVPGSSTGEAVPPVADILAAIRQHSS